MNKGDRFTWLHSETDHRFGEKCEVVAVRGDKIDYKFIDRPNWREATMPLDWAAAKKEYSEQQIAEIQKREKERRRRRR